MKELLLCPLLSRQKLDVIDEQDVSSSCLLVEVLYDSVVIVCILNGTDYLVCKLLPVV